MFFSLVGMKFVIDYTDSTSDCRLDQQRMTISPIKNALVPLIYLFSYFVQTCLQYIFIVALNLAINERYTVNIE